MKHFIDPKVDCVFKAIFGRQENEELVIDFLNGAVNFEHPIVEAQIANPYNEKSHLDAKLSIVDVKVRDQLGRSYQIEIQLTTPQHLHSRIIFTASQLHSNQIHQGDDFSKIKPTICIWLLTNDLPMYHTDDTCYQHKSGNSNFKFHFTDINKNAVLSKDMEIHIFQLNRWLKPATINGIDNWLYFFSQGHQWKALPNDVQTNSVLSEAMKVLEQFSEQEESYLAYLSRQQAQMKERSMEVERKQALEELDATKSELNETLSSLEQANKSLEKTNKSLEKTNKSLEKTSENLEHANEKLEHANEELKQSEAEKAALLERIKALEAQLK